MTDTATARQEPTLQERLEATYSGNPPDWPVTLMQEAKEALDAAQAREDRLRAALVKASNRLDWCAGLIENDAARDKAMPWGDDARAVLEDRT